MFLFSFNISVQRNWVKLSIFVEVMIDLYKVQYEEKNKFGVAYGLK